MKKLKYILLSTIMCFLYIDNVNANATCVYEIAYQTSSPTTRAKITCNASDSGVNCTAEGLSIEKNGVVITTDNFKKNNAYTCPSNIYAYIDAINLNVIGVSPIKGTEPGWESLKLLKSESHDDSSGSSGGNTTNPTEPTTPEPPTNNAYESDSRYIEAKAEADRYCNEQDFVYWDSTKCESAKARMEEIKNAYGSGYNPNDFTPTAFCQRKEVRSAFRVIGWAIFTIKIIVPILLIVMGSIDIAKAVVSSKDDELKKSIKTLTIRAIAGIIIFFIPSILNFVLNFFNGNGIYNETSGSFGYCTHCMLDPTDEACGNLMGGN